MAHLIDKSALVAEILKRREKNKKNKLNLAAAFEDNYFLDFLDTFEVKEVDSNDDFIEKACEFISLNVADYIDVMHKGGIEHLALRERFIEKFIDYMKGEEV